MSTVARHCWTIIAWSHEKEVGNLSSIANIFCLCLDIRGLMWTLGPMDMKEKNSRTLFNVQLANSYMAQL